MDVEVERTPLHVGMTVEQCWQPVPGGSGTYIARLSEQIASRPDVRLTGLSARHSAVLPDADFAPTLDSHAPSRLPRELLYEAWNRFRRPRADVGGGRRRLDLVHATTWAVPPTSRPLVVTVHDLAFLTDPDKFSARGIRFFNRSLARVRQEADLVIVPSRGTLDACAAVGIPTEKIRLIAHGVDMPAVTAAQIEEFRASRSLSRPYIMWCGTMEPRKNVTGLLEAFALVRDRLPGHDLVLVGPIGWGDQAPVAPDGASIHVLGKLSRGDLARAYAGADAFCYPSFSEGFGLPVLEAMSYGVPVVTSLGTPMEELVGETGVSVDPHSSGAIAEGLLAVVADRVALSKKALERSREFTWKAAADATVDVYRELV